MRRRRGRYDISLPGDSQLASNSGAKLEVDIKGQVVGIFTEWEIDFGT
ncbi:hypothetical protein AB9E09_04150 [Rhizobium leguminosarum]